MHYIDHVFWLLPFPVQVSLASADGGILATQDRFNGILAPLDNIKGKLGEYCVPAELWPSQKLRSGTAAVSPALGAMLGSSPLGSSIKLYQLSETQESLHHCYIVQLQLCSSTTDLGGVSLGHRSTTDEVAEGNQPEASSASPNPATPLQRGRAGGNQRISATPPSMRGSMASQVTPNLLVPSKEPSSSRSSTGKKSAGGQKQRGGSSVAGSENSSIRREETGSSMQLKVAQDLLKGEFIETLYLTT